MKEKLTEKINTLKIQPSVKDALIKISEQEEIQIQQAIRKMLKLGIELYFQQKERERPDGVSGKVIETK